MRCARISRKPALVVALCTGLAVLLGAAGPAYAADDCRVSLLMHETPDRSHPTALDGATISGDLYAFVAAAADPAQDHSERTTVLETVRFTLRRADGAGEPIVVTERQAAFDLGTTAKAGTARPFKSSVLPDGEWVVSAELAFKDETIFGCGDSNHGIVASFTVDNDGYCSMAAYVSDHSTRTGARTLSSRTLSGNAFVFMAGARNPDRELSERTTRLETVRLELYRINSTTMFIDVVERTAAFDLGTTAKDGTARPLRTALLPDGEYGLHAELTFRDETIYGCGDFNHGVTTTFKIDN